MNQLVVVRFNRIAKQFKCQVICLITRIPKIMPNYRIN